MKKAFAHFTALALLTACSLATPVDIGNAHRITLPSVAPSVTSKPIRKALIVSHPTAPESLDTFRMAFTDKDNNLAYFSGMRWADFLPSLVQESAVNSLSATGIYTDVMSDESIALGAQILQIEIKNFKAMYDASNAPATWNIGISFVWRNANNFALIKEQVISAKSQATHDTQEANEAAIMNAYREVMRQMVLSAPH